MKNHSSALKTGAVLMLALLFFWIYAFSKAYFNGEYEEVSLRFALCGAIEGLLVMGFFIILRREYPHDPNSKFALIFGVTASVMILLSSLGYMCVNNLQESLQNLHDLPNDVLEGKEHYIYMLQQASHYLSYGSLLNLVAFVFTLRLFTQNAKLATAVTILIFVYGLQSMNIFQPYVGDGNYKEAYALYEERIYILLMIKQVLYISALVYLVLAYADKDNVNALTNHKMKTSDWIAAGTIFLTLILFFKNWVYVEGDGYEHALLNGGHTIPLVAVGLVPIVWSAFSILLNNYKIRVLCGVLMIVWPFFAFIMALYQPVGETEMTLIDLDNFGPVDMSFYKFANFIGYFLLSVISGSILLNGANKPAYPAPVSVAPSPVVAPVMPLEPVAPVAPADDSATEVADE